MLNTLVKHKKTITIVLAAIWFVLLVLYAIWGSGEDKTTLLVATFICPLILYGFARIMFKIIGITASPKVVNFYLHFFLICGMWATVALMIGFITKFPNDYTVSLGLSMTMVIAVLDDAKKNMQS